MRVLDSAGPNAVASHAFTKIWPCVYATSAVFQQTLVVHAYNMSSERTDRPSVKRPTGKFPELPVG
ncbi:unnamed protein product [Clavelina lepadiformis]|uniref:Uncharacterized protein n=1 Tax=Clavelina lepadiformis TaxID=159417 RepID=A0ABP0F3F8_CLALP